MGKLYMAVLGIHRENQILTHGHTAAPTLNPSAKSGAPLQGSKGQEILPPLQRNLLAA